MKNQYNAPPSNGCPTAPGSNRRRNRCKKALAKGGSDFPRIIEREEDLITAMEGTLGAGISQPIGDFSDFGIEVYDATEKQKRGSTERHLIQACGPKVKNVYRVIPAEQNKLFNAYLKENGISRVKQLWHGSRNENWMSIIRNSLMLNQNAVITAKMFGKGIYFAPSSMKSWGYTSNGKWTGLKSDVSIMGLYAVAYGRQYDVSAWRENVDWKREWNPAMQQPSRSCGEKPSRR